VNRDPGKQRVGLRQRGVTRRELLRGAVVLTGGLGLTLLQACGQQAPAASPSPAQPAGAATKAPAAQGQPAASGGTVRIGAIAPLTGNIAKMGQEVVNSVKLAAEHQNAKGGVLGKQIEVVEGDDQGNPQQGVTVAEKFAADQTIMGVVHGITSVTCIPASEVFEKANLVTISPGCTNTAVTDRGLKVANRTCARDDAQAPAGAIFMHDELKISKVAVIDDGTSGPRGAADEYEKKAKSLGMTVTRAVIKSGDKDFRAILGTLPKDIQGIYAPVWAPDHALIAKQRKEVGLDVPLMGADGDFEPVDYIQAAGGAAEGNYVSFVGPDVRTVPEAATYVKDFEAKYGQFASYGPLAYEAANILFDGIKRAGKLDRAAIRDAVRNTKDFKGILGVPVSFDAKGDVAGGLIWIYQVKDGKFVQVKVVKTA